MTHTIAHAHSNTDLLAIVATAFLGLALLFPVSFATNTVLHNVSHDQRHSIGFPCH